MKFRKILTICILIILFSAVSVHAALLDEYNFVPLYVGGNRAEQDACTIKGNVYITVDTLEKYGDTGVMTVDREQKRILFEPSQMDVLFGDDVTTQFIKKYAGECYLPMKTIEDELYVSLNLVQQFAKLSYSANGSKGLTNSDATDITRVELKSYRSESTLGTVRNSTQALSSLYQGNGEYVQMETGELAFILSESLSMYKVQTVDGNIFYVSKTDFSKLQADEKLPDFLYAARKKKTRSSKFNLVWQSPSTSGVTALPPDRTGGIDVVAPVWFSQEVEGGGNIINYGDKGYVELAHERGFDVWATINNSMTTTGSTNYTTKVLADTELRNKTIAQYLFYACIYDIDGINIDYEDLSSQDSANIKANLVNFTAEMKKYTDRLGLVLSIDVMVPKSWNEKLYDYDNLAKFVDYMCVMSYDEHYAGSTYAGSVSSQSFYTEAIETLLGRVPEDKLVMGIPFYTRIWTVDGNGRKLSSYAAGMPHTRGVVEENGLEPVWMIEDGQYYTEFRDGNQEKRIWLEDARSIANRLSYVYYYKIAGTCCWRYGQQEDGIFEVFEAIYKNGASPGAYTDPY